MAKDSVYMMHGDCRNRLRISVQWDVVQLWKRCGYLGDCPYQQVPSVAHDNHRGSAYDFLGDDLYIQCYSKLSTSYILLTFGYSQYLLISKSVPLSFFRRPTLLSYV